MNTNDVITSTSRDEALGLVEDAERNFATLTNEVLHDRANSEAARMAIHRAKHHRDIAAVNAQLAIAEELREIRILLTAWLTQCTQVVI